MFQQMINQFEGLLDGELAAPGSASPGTSPATAPPPKKAVSKLPVKKEAGPVKDDDILGALDEDMDVSSPPEVVDSSAMKKTSNDGGGPKNASTDVDGTRTGFDSCRINSSSTAPSSGSSKDNAAGGDEHLKAVDELLKALKTPGIPDNLMGKNTADRVAEDPFAGMDAKLFEGAMGDLSKMMADDPEMSQMCGDGGNKRVILVISSSTRQQELEDDHSHHGGRKHWTNSSYVCGYSM